MKNKNWRRIWAVREALRAAFPKTFAAKGEPKAPLALGSARRSCWLCPNSARPMSRWRSTITPAVRPICAPASRARPHRAGRRAGRNVTATQAAWIKQRLDAFEAAKTADAARTRSRTAPGRRRRPSHEPLPPAFASRAPKASTFRPIPAPPTGWRRLMFRARQSLAIRSRSQGSTKSGFRGDDAAIARRCVEAFRVWVDTPHWRTNWDGLKSYATRSNLIANQLFGSRQEPRVLVRARSAGRRRAAEPANRRSARPHAASTPRIAPGEACPAPRPRFTLALAPPNSMKWSPNDACPRR